MTKPTRTELENTIARLEAQQAKDIESLQEVKVLLQQADDRRKAEPGNRRKWDRVLENLERGLDETKSRLNGCEVSLQAARRDLEACDEAATATATPAPVETPDIVEAEPVQGGYTEIANAIANAPLSDMGRFTLEQIALVTRELGRGITPENFPAFEKLAAHLEFANQHNAVRPADSPDPDRRKQILLRAAIDKVVAKNFDAMTQDEMRLLLASHGLLTKNLRGGEREERLKKLIENGIAEVARRLQTAT